MFNYMMSFFLGGLMYYIVDSTQNKFESVQKLYSSMYRKLEYENKEKKIADEIVSFRAPLELLTIFEICKFAVKICLIKIEQQLKQNCVPLGKYYILTHDIEGKFYRFIVKPKKGPLEDYDTFQLGFESIVCPFEDDARMLISGNLEKEPNKID